MSLVQPFVIPRDSKHPQQAWNFLSLWLRPDIEVAFFEHYGGDLRSARFDFYQSEAFHLAMRTAPYLMQIPTVFTTAQPLNYVRGSDVFAVMQPLLDQVRDGLLAPASALEEAERLVTAIWK